VASGGGAAEVGAGTDPQKLPRKRRRLRLRVQPPLFGKSRATRPSGGVEIEAAVAIGSQETPLPR